jgi:hypothetical protein
MDKFLDAIFTEPPKFSAVFASLHGLLWVFGKDRFVELINEISKVLCDQGGYGADKKNV